MRPAVVYGQLLRHFGPQGWWPTQASAKRKAKSVKQFEVCVGAILTQNTAWGNVEKALRNLIAARALDPAVIVSMKEVRLARLIRPAGYFRQKAKKLKIFSRWVLDEFSGEFERMKRLPLSTLRAELLSLWGIGPETADSMLLYALGKPSFVIDAYTKRLCDCFGIVFKDYHEYQNFFTSYLPKSVKLYNEYHALIVAWGKMLRNAPARAKAILK